MSGNYIDLVLCKLDSDDSKHLFYAPAYSWLTKGDVVTVETAENWIGTATVMAKLTVSKKDSEVMTFIWEILGDNPMFGKVKNKLSYIELHYDNKEDSLDEQGYFNGTVNQNA